MKTDLHTALYFAANICCGECWKFVSDLTMKFKITVYALVGFIVLMNISFNILVYLLLYMILELGSPCKYIGLILPVKIDLG